MPAPSQGDCPLCSQPIYGWVTLPGAVASASAGKRLPPEAPERVFDRCESCGVAIERGPGVDPEEELDAISEPGPGGTLAIDCANRASVQAFLGGGAWAPLDRLPGRLAHTPRSLALLAGLNGHRLREISFPPVGASQAWMWQTVINAFTFHNNFARDVRAGRLRPGRGRGRLAFWIDAMVTVLAAPLTALLSFPLEALASLASRGGRMVAEAGRDQPGPP